MRRLFFIFLIFSTSLILAMDSGASEEKDSYVELAEFAQSFFEPLASDLKGYEDLIYLRAYICAFEDKKREAMALYSALIADKSISKNIRALAAYDLACCYIENNDLMRNKKCLLLSKKYGFDKAAQELEELDKAMQESCDYIQNLIKSNMLQEAQELTIAEIQNGNILLVTNMLNQAIQLGDNRSQEYWQNLINELNNIKPLFGPNSQDRALSGLASSFLKSLSSSYPDLDTVD